MRALPFSIITLVAYNIIILFTEPTFWGEGILTLTLFSDSVWTMTYGDLMVTAALLVLLVEVLRATSVQTKAITNHALSVVVLVVYAVEFFIVFEAGNSTFFILTMIALLDVLGGIVVTIRLATRDFTIDRSMHPPVE